MILAVKESKSFTVSLSLMQESLSELDSICCLAASAQEPHPVVERQRNLEFTAPFEQ